MRYLILGDGIAGMSAAEAIRRRRSDPDAHPISVVSDDPQPFYFRASLTNYLMEELRPEELHARTVDSFERMGITRKQGKAKRIVPDDTSELGPHVVLESGQRLPYDRLLIATGASARRLSSPTDDPKRGVHGHDRPGVLVIRTYADAIEVAKRADQAKHAVVVGGGILGIEAAQGLHERGVHVTLIHDKDHLLNHVVDRRAGELIRLRMQHDGVRVVLEGSLHTITGDRERVSSVRLKEADGRPGDQLAADLVVVAIGNSPNTKFVADSGLALDKDLVPVDAAMRVEDPTGRFANVFAAGDLVRFHDESLEVQNPGSLWQPAKKQGAVAGLNMAAGADERPIEYRPGVLYNATRAWDLDLGTLGMKVDALDPDGSSVRVGTFDPNQLGKPVYKKIVVRNGRVVGALLLGDRREGHALRRLMNLRGAAADVSGVPDFPTRVFDARWDLFGWVAGQLRQPGVVDLEATTPLAWNARPAELGTRAHGETRRVAYAPGTATPLVDRAPGRSIRLFVNGNETAFPGPTVRIGTDPGCTVAVDDVAVGDEEIVLSLEGARWIASTTETLAPLATHNGAPLVRPVDLSDNDVIQLGRWKALATLSSLAAGVAEVPSSVEPSPRADAGPVRPPKASLVGNERHVLKERGPTSIGSSSEATVRLHSKGVESKHAQIRAEGSPPRWTLFDGPSEGGTFVNDRRLTLPSTLSNGDAIRVGSVTLRFQLVEPGHVDPTAETLRSGAATAWLVGVTGPLVRRALTVVSGATIGRGKDAPIRVRDPILSRLHAKFERKEGRWTIVDLGSENGVVISGARSKSGHPAPLTEGARVRLGRTEYRFTMRRPMERALTEAEATDLTGTKATVRLRHDGPSLRLDAEVEGGAPTVVPLAGDRITIGRDLSNVVVLMPVDVSSRHAELRIDGDGYSIVDLGSSRGTRVDSLPIEADQPVRLTDGARISFGAHGAVYRAGSGAVPGEAVVTTPRAGLRLTAPEDPERAFFPVVGEGPFVIGRIPKRPLPGLPESMLVQFPNAAELVGKIHARLRHERTGWTIEDAESVNGTFVRGQRVAPGKRVVLRDGDEIRLHDVAIRFELPPETDSGRPILRRLEATVDRGEAGNPLELDLEQTVRAELDACIGCHDCMRACPLPEANEVTIGALNALAQGVGEATGVVRDFVSACTQCHACVPVCPVDIRRSRIVLFNKLLIAKDVDPDRRLTVQVVDQAVESDWTIHRLDARIGTHRLLATLPLDARRRLLAAARVRRLAPHERLLVESSYPDAAWIVVEGTLELGVDRGADRGTRGGFQRTTLAGPGSDVGFDTLLADESSELTVAAVESALVVGFQKFVLSEFAAIHRKFAEALAELRAERSVAGWLSALPALASLSKDAVAALEAGLSLRTRQPGEPVFSAAEAPRVFGVVRRGFVREMRRLEGRSVVANYLHTGDAIGRGDAKRPGVFEEYVADTRAEVVWLLEDDVATLDRRHRGLREALFPGDRTQGGGGGAGAEFERFPPGHRVLRIDTRLCVDCDNCVTACERRHGHARLDRVGSARQFGPYQIPASCFHCQDPVCLHCDTDGIVRESGGEIRIVEENCVGCGQCAERCPYGNIEMVDREPAKRGFWSAILPDGIRKLLGMIDEEAARTYDQVAVKCDLCVGYDDGPACVRSCPVGAAERIDWTEMLREIDESKARGSR